MENKEVKYIEVIKRARALLEGEERPLPCMANICALLKEEFGFFWVGFYIVDRNQLVLGPFQGPVACMTINSGRGVCGTAWQRGETIVVEDVDQFPGHIACNPLSRSEIVVPLLHDGKVVAVLDIDHNKLSAFDRTDAQYLEQLLRMPFVGGISALCK